MQERFRTSTHWCNQRWRQELHRLRGERVRRQFLFANRADGVTSDMAVFRNEIFGPVAPVTVFETEEEAIQLANDTEFDWEPFLHPHIGRVWRVSEALDYGIVGVNEGIISNEMAPLEGVKESVQA